eukprot:SAG11_NODE_3453_length_2439_cov_3.079915_1_plen_225_part_10
MELFKKARSNVTASVARSIGSEKSFPTTAVRPPPEPVPLHRRWHCLWHPLCRALCDDRRARSASLQVEAPPACLGAAPARLKTKRQGYGVYEEYPPPHGLGGGAGSSSDGDGADGAGGGGWEEVTLKGEIRFLAAAAGGKVLYSAASNVRVWDGERGALTHIVHTKTSLVDVSCMVTARGPGLLLVGQSDGSVALIDCGEGGGHRCLRRLRPHRSAVTALAIDPA